MANAVHLLARARPDRSNFCQNEVTVTASADVPTLTGACLGVVYNIPTGKSDGLDFFRTRFDVRKVRYFPKRRPHDTTVSASRWVSGEGLWGFGRLTLDHVLPLHRSRPTRSRPWASWAPYGLKSSIAHVFNDPLSRGMPHTGATSHVQWTHSTVDYIYIAQQYSHGHVTYPLLVIRGCRVRSGHPGRGMSSVCKRQAESARRAACRN